MVAQAQLRQLRRIVKAVAPKADEGISYGMPYYKYKGALVGFAVFKNHIGFFPGAIVDEFKQELNAYKTSKGTVRLPIGKPLPVALLRRLVKARISANEAKQNR
jgi:uncharacterized protein YdhG (YjbR/CyaY superfamily)